MIAIDLLQYLTAPAAPWHHQNIAYISAAGNVRWYNKMIGILDFLWTMKVRQKLVIWTDFFLSFLNLLLQLYIYAYNFK